MLPHVPHDHEFRRGYLLNPLELELGNDVSHQLGIGNQTQVPLPKQKVLLPVDPSLQFLGCNF